MEMVFSSHARHRMTERRISEKLVKRVMRDPDQVIQGPNQRKVAQKHVRWHNRDMLCRVVFEEEADRVLVVTLYITSKYTKYS